MVALGAGLAWTLWRLRPGTGADFEVRSCRGGRVEVRGRIPKANVGEIRTFFARDFPADRAGTVRGWFGPGGTLRVRFRGGLVPGERQRVRNFLMERLR